MKTIRVCILALVAITTVTQAKPQQQKPAAQPTQAQLQQQIEELKKRLDEAELKAKSADLDKDYITRVQKQYEAYYEKVLSTQTTTVALVGILISIILAIAAKFSFDIFDTRTKTALEQAITQQRNEYAQTLATEVQKLKESNDKEMKSLSDALRTEITDESNDLRALSRWNLHVAQGFAFGASQDYARQTTQFRRATEVYKLTKPRNILSPKTAANTIHNTLLGIDLQAAEEQKAEKIREELSNHLYDGLEIELALVAVAHPEYAQAINQRQNPTPPASQPTAQATAAEEPPPAGPAEPETESE